MLKVTSQRCYLPASKTPFVIRSYCSETIEVNELIDIMATGRTTLSKTDIEAVMRLLFEEVQDLICKGYYVKTPIGNLYLNTSGSLVTEDEPFCPNDMNNNHEIKLHYRNNPELEELCVKNAKYERIEKLTLNSPKISLVECIGNKDLSKLKAGDAIIIKGKRLNFKKDEEFNGVLLKNETDSYLLTEYSLIKPSMIIAQLPKDIKIGNYEISVCSTRLTKEVKENTYNEMITII